MTTQNDTYENTPPPPFGYHKLGMRYEFISLGTYLCVLQPWSRPAASLMSFARQWIILCQQPESYGSRRSWRCYRHQPSSTTSSTSGISVASGRYGSMNPRGHFNAWILTIYFFFSIKGKLIENATPPNVFIWFKSNFKINMVIIVLYKLLVFVELRNYIYYYR